MLVHVVIVLLAGVPVCLGAADSEYYDADGVNEDAGFDNKYDEEIRAAVVTATVMDAVTRMKKRELEGALQNILRLTRSESPQAVVQENTNSYNYIEKSNDIQKEKPVNRDGSNGSILYKKWLPDLQVQNWIPSDETQENVTEHSNQTDQRRITVYQTGASTFDIIALLRKMAPVFGEKVVTRSSPVGVPRVLRTDNIQTWSIEDQPVHPSDDIQALSSDVQSLQPTVVNQTLTTTNDSDSTQYNMVYQHTSTNNNSEMQAEVRKLVPHWNLSSNVQHWRLPGNVPWWNLFYKNVHSQPPGQAQHWGPAIVRQPPFINNKNKNNNKKNNNNKKKPAIKTTSTTTTTTTTSTTSTTPKHTTTRVRLDLDMIINLVKKISSKYVWNISDYFNETLVKAGYSTCAPKKMTTTITTTTMNKTTGPYDFANAAIVSKCFVCGLKTPEIPRNAYCADAFAGDFLPLMPTDPRSRGRIASFRKYCRHVEAQNYVETPSEPRAIYGRFTGGCAVRWSDLTGVYTQRTCRSKYRPLLGKHLASKRMAKLELALVNEEDSCIISPMATLLPVSRGISLYSRFHVCVCSANWCNKATHTQPSLYSAAIFALACWLAHYT